MRKLIISKLREIEEKVQVRIPVALQAANRPSRQARTRHLDYLKQYRKVTYTNLLTSDKQNTYLVVIDRQAQKRFEQLNNTRECARKIVNKEFILV